ncbi:acetyl-CoA synthetase-like protein [Obba rivulosa]|uniref:Acetyl-CoA synthetase-like protein n=1 Tax=Obba rivulosa TaxID=1052685 RepID=A0A8E2DJR5_9APHY|nr:acetyl-CoA synthetase-like protein [Obba rivulosa]
MFDVTSCRTLQGANSSTWHRPALDGSLTLPELYAWHAEHSPEHPLFVHADDEKKLHHIYYPEAFRAIRKAAQFSRGQYTRVEDEYNRHQTSQDQHVIGILANTDSITFFTFMVGVMYLGLTPFPLSTRNSSAAVVHLVRSTGVRLLFVSSDPAMQRLSHQAQETLRAEGHHLELVPMPQFGDLYNESNEGQDVQMGKLSIDNTILILHSSGSTAFPKPITLKGHNFLQWGTAAYYGELDICGLVIGSQSPPMFHAMGAANLMWPVCVGVVVAFFKPCSPPVIPTPEVLLDSVIATNCGLVYCVPSFVEAWARDPANLPVLKSQKAIAYGGAPLEKATGDMLRAEGVKLLPFYGLTETGGVSMFVPDLSQHEDWDYFPFSSHVEIALEPHEREGIFELFIFESENYCPNVLNATVRGRRAYATNDLLQRHPTRPDLWRIFGRADDQIMLSTGEKTNPGPLEAILLKDPHIAAAIIFGRGRFQNGVLIQPREHVDPQDEKQLAEFRNKIWPTVEKMNEYAPQHSRIFKEMIVVTSPSKPLEFTAKGTPRRQICLNAYESEIDAAYAAVENSSQTDLAPPPEWTQDTAIAFVRAVVEKVLAMSLAADDDLFQNGCDSLQATYIRNAILKALRVSTNIPTHKVPLNFVYSNPTICALSDFVWSLFTEQQPGNAEAQLEAKAAAMRAMVEKYSKDFGHLVKPAQNGFHTDDGETFLVTGTTGRLGCHLLSQLLQDPKVIRIFALNRGAPGSEAVLAQRQQDAFTLWGLDASLLASSKLTLFAGDYPKPLLGLSEDAYHEIQNSVTTIIHNAWRVDFNLALTSFEPLVAGMRNLIDLSLGSPKPQGPRITFISSISSLFGYKSSEPAAEEHISDPRMSVGMGYGESKYVAEQLLAHAAQETGLRTTVVRVGQISGDTRVGGWNPKEWVAAIVAVSQIVGCIPSRDEELTWLPVDTAASALIEFSHSDEPVLHLIHPRPVSWNAIFTPIAERLRLELVSYSEWLNRLRIADDAQADESVGQKSSALALREFFESGVSEADMRLDTTKAVRASKTLQEIRPLGKEDAMKWLNFWAKVDHIKL